MPKTTFTPITLPTPAPKPNRTPAEERQKRFPNRLLKNRFQRRRFTLNSCLWS
jgi:hypothetical protein